MKAICHGVKSTEDRCGSLMDLDPSNLGVKHAYNSVIVGISIIILQICKHWIRRKCVIGIFIVVGVLAFFVAAKTATAALFTADQGPRRYANNTGVVGYLLSFVPLRAIIVTFSISLPK